MLLFLSTSCEQEEIMDIHNSTSLEQQKSSKSKNTSKLSDEQIISQIEDLKNGTKRAYKKYNKKHPKRNFKKRFGKPIVNEIKYIQFTDDNLIMILPLVKKNHKKRKVLAAYYKNGKKTYKVFTNKKYKRNESESVSERNLLNSLNIFFKTSKNKNYQSKAGSYEEYLYSSDCWDVYQVHELDYSYRSYRNTCNTDKGNDEIYDEWDEPADPPADDDNGDVTDYCDSGDPTCDDGTGGGTGSDGGDSSNATTIEEITTELPECLDKIIDNLKMIQDGKMGQIIQQFAGKNPVPQNYNWNVVEGTCSKPSATACTSPTVVNNMVTTTINSSNVGNATNISMARTFLHELFHAYLNFVYRFQNIDKSYKSLIDSFSEEYNNNANDIYHRVFIEVNVIDHISEALMNYGDENELNLSEQFCRDMAWAGLQGTKAYNSLDSNDKLRIENTLGVELYNTESNGIYPKGSKACN